MTALIKSKYVLKINKANAPTYYLHWIQMTLLSVQNLTSYMW